jgi:hypothetical protein
MTDLNDATLDEIIAELKRRASRDTTPNYIDGKWVAPEFIIPENEQLKTYQLLDLIKKLLDILDDRDVDIADVYEF